MPGLTMIIKQQTDNYKKSINPEPEANIATPVISFLSNISIFAMPVKHFTGKLGRDRADAYCKKLQEMVNEDEIADKLYQDLFSNTSPLAGSKKYTKELKIGLLAYLTGQSVDQVNRDIKIEADQEMSLYLKSAYQYGGLPKQSELFMAVLMSRLKKALPIDVIKDFFPESANSKSQFIFEL